MRHTGRAHTLQWWESQESQEKPKVKADLPHLWIWLIFLNGFRGTVSMNGGMPK